MLLVTSCSVGKVRHIRINQCLEFQRILKFVGRQLVASFHDPFSSQPPTVRKTAKENNVPIFAC